jgi:hypothetical protein
MIPLSLPSIRIFHLKKHVDFEIFKFREAKQQPRETVDQFSTRLRKLAATCDFANIDKEVKSAIIQNCLSKRLRRYALLDSEVTLAKILAKGRAFELSESQATGIENAVESTKISDEVVEAVHPTTKSNNNHRDQQHTSFHRQDFYTSSQCRNCGGPWPHNNNICPAQGKSCLNCGKSNHFAKVCRSARKARVGQQDNRRSSKYHKNKVHKIYGKPTSSESSSEDEFIFTLKPTCRDKTTPQVQISVNTTPINMVIDTGASIDIIDELAFNTLRKQRPIALQRSKTRIFAYGATN